MADGARDIGEQARSTTDGPPAEKLTNAQAAARTPPARTGVGRAAKKAAGKKTAGKQTTAKKATPTKAATKKTTPQKATQTKATQTKAAKKPAAKKPATRKTAAAKPDAGAPAQAETPGQRRGADRPSPRTSGRPSRSSISAAARPAREDRPLHAVPDPPEQPVGEPEASAGEFDRAVGLLVDGLRAAGGLAGLQGEDLERRIATALGFLRRRLTGDYQIDDFGFDAEFTEQVWLPLLRPLFRKWFRVEVRGAGHIPAAGPALIVANHSGTLPIDGLMTQVAVHDEHPQHRNLRMLGADLVFESPLIGELSRRSGTTLASNADAERLFAAGELVAVFPEGFKGVGKPFAERYKLQRFGRGGFVSAALRAQVPIIPCAIVGAEEIFPMIGNASGLARLLGFPYFPITPFFPLLGLAGMIPLPSKWIIEFGAPIDTDAYGEAAAEDPMVVFELTDQVRETIQQSLYSLLLQRRSVFF